ncbi:MAG: thermonuclease family protein [Saprospirales bacterium]|nr:MAG: thermonuclease family protein [Saprospirales bacterium]
MAQFIKFLFRSVLIAILFCALGCSTGGITGTVIQVTDGDSFHIAAEGKRYEVRLNGIDCPELDQAYGYEATAFAAEYLYQLVEFKIRDMDRYGRYIADVYKDGTWLNRELVEQGLAWHYKQYSDDQRLARSEEAARSAKLGLWAEEDPTPPWEWRRKGGNATRQTGDYPAPSPAFLQWATSNNSEVQNTAFICNSPGASAYHLNHMCRFLQNCSREIYWKTTEMAREKERTLCNYCRRNY